MHFQILFVTLLGQTASSDLALTSAALLGVVGVTASPSVKFTPTLWRGCHMPIGFLIFTTFVQTPWMFVCAGFSNVSDMDIYLRGPLQY